MEFPRLNQYIEGPFHVGTFDNEKGEREFRTGAKRVVWGNNFPEAVFNKTFDITYRRGRADFTIQVPFGPDYEVVVKEDIFLITLNVVEKLKLASLSLNNLAFWRLKIGKDGYHLELPNKQVISFYEDRELFIKVSNGKYIPYSRQEAITREGQNVNITFRIDSNPNGEYEISYYETSKPGQEGYVSSLRKVIINKRLLNLALRAADQFTIEGQFEEKLIYKLVECMDKYFRLDN